MAWPIRALMGREASVLGVRKNKIAVGPSEGKTNELPVTRANSDKMAMVTKPLMNIKAAHTTRELYRSSKYGSRNRSKAEIIQK